MTDSGDKVLDGAPSGETPQPAPDDYCERCGVWMGEGSAFGRGEFCKIICDECEEDDMTDAPAEPPVIGYMSSVGPWQCAYCDQTYEGPGHMDRGAEHYRTVHEPALNRMLARAAPRDTPSVPREEPQPANDYDALHDAATDRAEVERVAGYPGVSWAGRGAGPGKYVLISETERDALVRCARYWLDRPSEEPQPTPSGEALEALTELRKHFEDRGLCHILEKRGACDCPLCLIDRVRAALSGLPQEPTPTLEQIVSVAARLARWESGAMGEDGWWFDTDEKLIAAVRDELRGSPPSPPPTKG